MKTPKQLFTKTSLLCALASALVSAPAMALPVNTPLGVELADVVAGLAGTQTADLPWWTLGWTLADWATAIGWMAGLGSIAAGTLALGWWNARRAMGVEFPTGDMLPAPVHRP